MSQTILHESVHANKTWPEAEVLELSSPGFRLPTFAELRIISASDKNGVYREGSLLHSWFWSCSEDPVPGYIYAVNFENGTSAPLTEETRCNVRLVRGSKDDIILWCFENLLKGHT